MLGPQDNATRETKNLDGLWAFALDRDQLAAGAEMAVPASYNDIGGDATLKNHVGPVWYERTVWVPAGWQGRRIVLHLESATHRARVLVDDVEVVTHAGGYLPFEVDVHRPRTSRVGLPADRRGGQPAHLPDHPAGGGRADSAR